MPQARILVGMIRISSSLKAGLGPATPVIASAVPRISIPRGVHGLTETRSSTTNATRGSRWMFRNLKLSPSRCPPMSIVRVCALYRIRPARSSAPRRV